MSKNFLNKDGYVFKKRPKIEKFNTPDRELKEIDYFTDEELYQAKNSVLVFDLEVYPNYFLAAFKHYTTGKVVIFELYPEHEVFEFQKLLWIMHNFCIVGFNSLKFDLPIIWLAINGASIDQLQEAVDKIIFSGAMPKDIEETYGFKQNRINHIDLIEVAPLSASLKTYGSRLHSDRLQDLPFDPQTRLSKDQLVQVRHYCINDLDVTALLLKDLEPQLELRYQMSIQYGQDLRSKSDAQIAEAVIASEISKLKGYLPRKPKLPPGTSFKYQIPDFIQYQNQVLKDMLEIVRNASFVINENGSITMPPELDGFTVKIGNSIYRMGIGGLHSSEECIYHKQDDNYLLIDRDVASYYPAIILNQRLYPKHLGEDFLSVYRSIVKERLAAKKRVGEIKKEILYLKNQLTNFS